MITVEQTPVYQPNFLAIATKMVSMGAYVVPVPTGQKACVLPDWQNKATRDLLQIEKWHLENNHYNCAIVGKPEVGALWGFDDDSGVLAEYEATHGPIKTYRTKTVSGGIHLLFKHNQQSIAMGNLSAKNEHNQELFSARMNNRYVISAGSVAHPHNDPSQPLTAYTAIDTSAPIEAPDTFIRFLQDKAAAKTEKGRTRDKELDDESVVHEGGRNNMLASVLGRARQVLKMDKEELYEYGRSVNQKRCLPPLPDSEVRTIANSIGRYEVKEASPVVIDGVDLSKAAQIVTPANWRDSFKSVGELEQGEVRMLIDGVLPEGTIFIGGLPGEGKTLFALSIAKALTTGDSFLGKFFVNETIPVVYLIPEMGGRAFRTRCEKFGIPNDPDMFLCRTVSEGGTLPLDDASLFEAVRRLKPVVILDTIIRFSEAEDENQAMQNKALVDDIIRLRQAGAVAVIGLHHATKAMREKGMTLETALRGTGDIAASADAVYGLLRDSMLYNNGVGPNEIDVACLKPRDFEPPQPFRIALTQKSEKGLIKFDSVIDRYKDFLVVSKSATEQASGDTLERLVKEDPAISIKELARATGQTTWQIRKALTARKCVKARGGAKHGSRWMSPANRLELEDVNPESSVPLAPDVNFDSVVTNQAIN